MERVVPRRDAAHHADGLAHHQRVADGFLELELAQHLGVVGRSQSGQPGLDALRQLQGHADFTCDRACDLVAACAEARGDLFEVHRTFRRRRRRPRGERRLGRRHRLLDVSSRALGSGAHHFLGRRVDHVDLAAPRRCHPRSVDVQSVTHLHSSSPLQRSSGCRALTFSLPLTLLEALPRLFLRKVQTSEAVSTTWISPRWRHPRRTGQRTPRAYVANARTTATPSETPITTSAAVAVSVAPK